MIEDREEKSVKKSDKDTQSKKKRMSLGKRKNDSESKKIPKTKSKRPKRKNSTDNNISNPVKSKKNDEDLSNPPKPSTLSEIDELNDIYITSPQSSIPDDFQTLMDLFRRAPPSLQKRLFFKRFILDYPEYDIVRKHLRLRISPEAFLKFDPPFPNFIQLKSHIYYNRKIETLKLEYETTKSQDFTKSDTYEKIVRWVSIFLLEFFIKQHETSNNKNRDKDLPNTSDQLIHSEIEKINPVNITSEISSIPNNFKKLLDLFHKASPSLRKEFFLKYFVFDFPEYNIRNAKGVFGISHQILSQFDSFPKFIELKLIKYSKDSLNTLKEELKSLQNMQNLGNRTYEKLVWAISIFLVKFYMDQHGSPKNDLTNNQVNRNPQSSINEDINAPQSQPSNPIPKDKKKEKDNKPFPNKRLHKNADKLKKLNSNLFPKVLSGSLDVKDTITKNAKRRLARRAGVKRFNSKIYEEVFDSLKENFLRPAIEAASVYTYTANRKTLQTSDIVKGIRSTGRTLYFTEFRSNKDFI